jgi:uncharacterized membrane protein
MAMTEAASSTVARSRIRSIGRRGAARLVAWAGDEKLSPWLVAGFVVLHVVVCTENLNPNVLTMKSAQYGARIYDAGSLNLARDRRILVQ